MQHYGAPTRLLDFTYSIYVAAYFALEKATNVAVDHAAIWSIDIKWAVRESKELLRKAGKTQVTPLPPLSTEAEERTISDLIFDMNPVRMAWPVNPFRLNERLMIQRGIFLVPGDIAVSHMDNLAALPGYDENDRVLKIRLPRQIRREALRQLFHMNISHTSLFPGLDGYAHSLGIYHPTIIEPKWGSEENSRPN